MNRLWYAVAASIFATPAAAQSIESLSDWLAEAGQDHMSPVGMYLAADIVVKGVMVTLFVASVLVWAVFFAKLLSLGAAKARLRRGYRNLDERGTLEGVHVRGRAPMNVMIRTAQEERDRSARGSVDGTKERTENALSRIETGAARKASAGTALLAITGSSAPFIGLFGTVWGIMNSFISIAETNTTNLAVVAPGIAEALLATAIGLVAAIPAVIFYNLLARSIGGYRVMLGDASALVYRTLSRDLDLAKSPVRAPIISAAAE